MLDFYDVTPSYLDYLRSIDKKVPQNNYASHKKFMCGVFVMLNGQSYLIPVSSSYGKPREFRIITFDRNGGQMTLAALKYSFMIPVPYQYMTKRIIAKEQDRDYKALLRKEIAYIKRNEKTIRSEAQKVYEDVTDPNSQIKKYCCDFEKLEREATAAGYQKFLAEQQAGKNGTVSTAPGASAAAASQQTPAAAAADPASSIPAAPTDASTASAASSEAPALDQTGAASAASPQLLSMVATIAAQPSAPGAQKQSVKKNEIVNE